MTKTSRLAIGACVAVLALIAARLASRDVPAVQDEGLRPAAAAVPDSDNAYPLLERLEAADPVSAADRPALAKALDGTAPDAALADRLLARSEPVFALLDEFARKRGFQAPQDRDLDKRGPETPLIKLAPLVDAARLRALRADRLVRAGRAEPALAEALAIADAGRVLLRSRGPLIQTLGGFLLIEIGAKAARGAIASGLVPHDALKSAAARLAAPLDGAAALREGLRYEYLTTSNIIDELPQRMAKDPTQPAYRRAAYAAAARGGTYFYQPRKTKQLFADRMRDVIEAAGRPCGDARWPSDQPKPYLGRPNMVGLILFDVAAPSYAKLSARRCAAEFRVTAAATAAAVAAYRLEHARPPLTAAELAPEFLPSAPQDPFTGEAAAYSADRGELSTAGTDPDGKPL